MTAHGTRYQVEGEQLTVAAIAARIGTISVAAAHARLKRARERGPEITWASLGVGAPPSRQQRMLQFVATLGRPATLEEVIAEAARHEPGTDRSQLGNAVAAQLAQLVKAEKLTRTGQRCSFTYTPTANTLVDGRSRAGRWKNAKPKLPKAPKPPKPPKAPKPPKPKVERPAKPPKAKPAPKPAKAPKPTAPPRAVPAAPPPVVVPNANLTRPREGDLDSAHIAAHIAAFEASGGRVERLPNGLTSQPMKCYLAAQAAARRPHPSNDSDLDADDLVDVA